LGVKTVPDAPLERFCAASVGEVQPLARGISRVEPAKKSWTILNVDQMRFEKMLTARRSWRSSPRSEPDRLY
jgi:hypothetical protein